MSTAGQIVGGVVGGLIGSTLGSPYLGAQLGIMLGGYLDPVAGPVTEGPRLDDLTVQTSTYGAQIPRIFGTQSVSGNVFWLENNKIKEVIVKKSTGGKGGSKTTTKTPTYYATFAVGLADRPDGPIFGVRRIWIKGELFYDVGSTDPATIMASNEAAPAFKIYTGSDTQQPDPRIQADVGVDNAPAYRGLAYIVFYDLPLEKYANSLAGAQVKVEVVCSGIGQYFGVRRLTGANKTWNGGLSNPSIFTHDGDKWVDINGDNVYITDSNDTWSQFKSNLPLSGRELSFRNGMYVTTNTGAYPLLAYSTDLKTWVATALPFFTYDQITLGPGDVYLVVYGKYWALASPISTGFSYSTGEAADGLSIAVPATIGPTTAGDIPTQKFLARGAWNGSCFIVVANNKYRRGTISAAVFMDWSSVSLPAGMSHVIDVISVDSAFYSICVSSSNASHMAVSYDDGVTWSVIGMIVDSVVGNLVPLSGLAHNGVEFCCVLIFGLDYSYVTSSDGITWSHRKEFSASNLGGSHFSIPVWGRSLWGVQDSDGGVTTFGSSKITSTDVSLSDIVTSELGNVGLTSDDIDTLSLVQSVRGYVIGSSGSVRSAIEPLRTAWPFDVIQHGYKVRFVARGSAPVTTIDANDLDAHNSSSGPTVKLTTVREMDTQMPSKMTIRFADFDREYEVGEQYSEYLSPTTINSVTLELAIVMTSAEAAGRAEMLLQLAWLERNDFTFNLPGTYNHLEPSDVILLPMPGGTLRVRLTTLNYTSDGRIECSGKNDSATVYTPVSTGSTPKVTGQTTIKLSTPTEVSLLDIPTINTNQSDASFLAALYGMFSSWQAGTLLRSDDGGTTWVEIESAVAPGSTIGSATSVIGSVDSRVWDKSSRLNVSLYNGDLYDTTEIGLMNGANHFAYGVDGRWEIIAAQRCGLVSGANYILSDFLRGRFGTEWAMALHAVGDTIVLLDHQELSLITTSISNVGAEKLYRAISINQPVENGRDLNFTYNGINLKCLSPVSLNGNRAPSGDWSFWWTRRSRTDWEWRDGSDVALGETSEAYETDIFTDNTYSTVKRTVSSSTAMCGYTNAQQVADFGTVQGDIYWKVYQLSSVVGRGYPATGFSTTRHYLVVANCDQGSTSPPVTMPLVFNAAPSLQVNTSSDTVIIQLQFFVAAPSLQDAVSSAAAITMSHNLVVSQCSQGNDSSSTAVTQDHNIVVDGSTQANSSPDCSVIPSSPNADPFWYFVKALVLMDTTTPDDKIGNTVTEYYGPSLETTDAPFSGGYILNAESSTSGWPGATGVRYLEMPGMPSYVLGTSPFCIETFVKTTDGSDSVIVDFYDQYHENRGWSIVLTGGRVALTSDPYGSFIVQADDYVDDGSMHHIAVTSDGNTPRIWIDGTEAASYADQVTGYDPIDFQSDYLRIAAGSYSYSFVGKVGPTRITVGNERYTSSFTPPTDFPYS